MSVQICVGTRERLSVAEARASFQEALKYLRFNKEGKSELAPGVAEALAVLHAERAPHAQSAADQPFSEDEQESLIAQWALEKGCTMAQMRESLRGKWILKDDDGTVQIISLASGVEEMLGLDPSLTPQERWTQAFTKLIAKLKPGFPWDPRKSMSS